jgi:hypothetical protein
MRSAACTETEARAKAAIRTHLRTLKSPLLDERTLEKRVDP